LKLKAPRRQPELPNHYFSLSKRSTVRHFEAQGAEKAARAPKASLFIIKPMPCEPFRGPRNPEGCESSQSITFRYQMDAIGGVTSIARSISDFSSHHFSSSEESAGHENVDLGWGCEPLVCIMKSMLWEALRSSRPPELLKHHFSLANRCPVIYFGTQGARRLPELTKPLLFIIKSIGIH